MNLTRILCLCVAALTPTVSMAQNTPTSTTFTYQGRLFDGGSPGNGNYDLTFALYDAATGGNQLGLATANGVGVTNGLFTVGLDFGAAFDGSARWLELAERPNGAATFATLAPRQFLAAAPYSTFAAKAATAGALSGTLPLNQLPPGVVTNNFAGDLAVSGNLSCYGHAFLPDLVVGNWVRCSDLTATNGITCPGLTVWRDLLNAQHGLAVSGNLTCDAGVLCSWLMAGSQVYCDQLKATNDITCRGLTCQGNVLNAQNGVAVSGNLTCDAGVLCSWLMAGSQVYCDQLKATNDITCREVSAYVFNNLSDRSVKGDLVPVSPEEILGKVARLQISRWNFKGSAGEAHLGPMAQDFYAAFGLGRDDRHIATVDADGVALASIQGLNRKLEEKLQEEETRIRAQAARIEHQAVELSDLKARLERLEQLVSSARQGQ